MVEHDVVVVTSEKTGSKMVSQSTITLNSSRFGVDISHESEISSGLLG